MINLWLVARATSFQTKNVLSRAHMQSVKQWDRTVNHEIILFLSEEFNQSPMVLVIKTYSGYKSLYNGLKTANISAKTLLFSTFNSTNIAFVETCLPTDESNFKVYEEDTDTKHVFSRDFLVL